MPAGWADGARLRRAVETVLTDPWIRQGARRARTSFATARGALGAADRVEALLHIPSTTCV